MNTPRIVSQLQWRIADRNKAISNGAAFAPEVVFDKRELFSRRSYVAELAADRALPTKRPLLPLQVDAVLPTAAANCR